MDHYAHKAAVYLERPVATPRTWPRRGEVAGFAAHNPNAQYRRRHGRGSARQPDDRRPAAPRYVLADRRRGRGRRGRLRPGSSAPRAPRVVRVAGLGLVSTTRRPPKTRPRSPRRRPTTTRDRPGRRRRRRGARRRRPRGAVGYEEIGLCGEGEAPALLVPATSSGRPAPGQPQRRPALPWPPRRSHRLRASSSSSPTSSAAAPATGRPPAPGSPSPRTPAASSANTKPSRSSPSSSAPASHSLRPGNWPL